MEKGAQDPITWLCEVGAQLRQGGSGAGLPRKNGRISVGNGGRDEGHGDEMTSSIRHIIQSLKEPKRHMIFFLEL